jgi:hypothetical protein
MQTRCGPPPPSAKSQRFTDLQERHAMTQISGIKSEQSERSRASRTQTTNAKPMLSATAASSTGSPSQIWKRIRALVLFNIRVRAACPRAGRATAPQPSAWWDELRTQHLAGTGMALLFAGLAPALVTAALWHTAEIAPFIFTFTFAIALGHAVLLGLPLFLVFRSMSWINLTTCVVFGFAVGAAPVGVLTWPMRHPELHTSASVVGVLMIINEAITAIGSTSYVKPLIYFGSFGALGGFAFWVALIWCGTFESDFFNPSITRFPGTKDGGFGAAFRAGRPSRRGSTRQNGREIACVSEKTQSRR